MIVKQDFQDYLRREGLSKSDFARKTGMDEGEVDKLCNAESVEYDTAKKFINYLGARKAQNLIDWEKMNIQNPLKETRGEQR